MNSVANDSDQTSTTAVDRAFRERVFRMLGLKLGERLSHADLQVRQTEQRSYLRLLLAANGYQPPGLESEDPLHAEAATLLHQLHRRSLRATQRYCPVDGRIQEFLNAIVPAGHPSPQLPYETLVLDRPGLARELSLPFDRDDCRSDLLESYRTLNGVLHNPKHDRRTTSGTFHVVEGSFLVPNDKREVPRGVFARLLEKALQPPDWLATIPYTSTMEEPARGLVSLMLRPIVSPAVSNTLPEQRMEIRFFVPGSLVANLDFVESIFGNAGNPYDPVNDAALDLDHWSGHTGCVILAPHLIELTKQELGLPHIDQADERQRRDAMCWSDPAEKYNDGQAFKLTCRTEAGVVVTLIADNYFGYCKKEVKSQISYAANLMGHVEEEHAGGTLAFQSYSLGDEFKFDSRKYNNRTWDDVRRDYADLLRVDNTLGYATLRDDERLVFVKEDAVVSINEQCVRWEHLGETCSIPLLPGKVYMGPSGYRVRLDKHPAAPTWRLLGTLGTGTFCHKPCTVSGGGKSEISKSLWDFMLYGPIFVQDLEKDFALVREIFEYDYSNRWKENLANRPDYSDAPSRKVLDPNRTLGSVIKLLTPSSEYNDAYNKRLSAIPNYIYALVFIIKRFQRPGWEEEWSKHFYVDVVNGEPGHELKYQGRTLQGQYLRVGLQHDQAWRTFKLRQDFAPAEKLQTEDDITASVVACGESLEGLSLDRDVSHKFAINCEYRLFQRPDEAIHRGFDKQTESDLAEPNNFLSNFQPLSGQEVEAMIERVIDLDRFTPPMQQLLRTMKESSASYVVSSSNPRVIGDRVSKNPRYLQTRPDLVRPFEYRVAEMGWRLYHALPSEKPVSIPVHAVLFGRRNNPPDVEAGIRGLSVYNPIHYQPLPELMIEFVTSLSGKSPSTTGFGSEGALTKGPFNSLPPTFDLNAALVSYALTGLHGYSTPAGHIGPRFRVDHDISLLIPEIWCRLKPEERDPHFLLREKFLEPVKDFEFEGRTVLAGRLGYRITAEFVRRFMGRVFDNPGKVFDDLVLKPEDQDRQAFAEGIDYIVGAQQRIAKGYFEDDSIRYACPPLRQLLEMMAEGARTDELRAPDFVAQFSREAILDSDWYHARLEAAVESQRALWRRKVAYLKSYGAERAKTYGVELGPLLTLAQQRLASVEQADAIDRAKGWIGATPFA
ncbi:MAG: hypothetical protein R3B96_07165 [Pirellulaceae bacterium]